MILRNHLFRVPRFTHEKNEVSKVTQLSQVTQLAEASQDPQAAAWTLSPTGEG